MFWPRNSHTITVSGPLIQVMIDLLVSNVRKAASISYLSCVFL